MKEAQKISLAKAHIFRKEGIDRNLRALVHGYFPYAIFVLCFY